MLKLFSLLAVGLFVSFSANAQSINGSITGGLATVNQQSLSQGSVGGGQIGAGLNPTGAGSVIHSSSSQGLGGNLTSFNARTGELKTVSEHNVVGSAGIATKGAGSTFGSVGASTYGGSSMGSSSVVGAIGGVGLKVTW